MRIPETINEQLSGISFDELISAMDLCGQKENFKRRLIHTTSGRIFEYETIGIRVRLKHRYKIRDVYQRRAHYFSGRNWLVTMRTVISDTIEKGYELYPFETISLNIHRSRYGLDDAELSGRRKVYDVQFRGNKDKFRRDLLLLKMST